MLGVGPGKTTRTAETDSPVAALLAERGAKLINVNMLRYASEPALVDVSMQEVFSTALQSAMMWAVDGRVRPHVGKVIDASVDAVNVELAAMRRGASAIGKTVVVVDRSRGQ
jgi:hypothetical protein